MAQAAWIWWLSGGVLALAGLVLLWWSLFNDRARGRRRCPKCWYDMGGVPGLVCPECGRDARRERRLGKIRRRWRWAAIGAMVSASAFSLAAVPRVRLYGPASLLPTTVLLWASPTIEQTWTSSDNRYLAWLEKQHDGMMIELARRASTWRASLADWQWRYWIEHKHVIHAWRSESDPQTVYVQLDTPPPLGSADAIRIRTVVRSPVELDPEELLVGPVYPDRPPPRSIETPPPTGWVVSSGIATDGWNAYPGQQQSFSLIFPPRSRTSGPPFRSMPTLSGQLWDHAAESLVLEVEYLRDLRERAVRVPNADEEAVVWNGRVAVPIREQAPPGFFGALQW